MKLQVASLESSWLRSSKRETAVVCFLGVSTAILFVRVVLFIKRYAVNVLYWDQWDFWKGMLEERSWWELFTWQHGPQREGLGYAVIKLTALASHWDMRAEAIVISVLFLASTGLALAIKRRLTHKWSFFDVCIPLATLTLGNYESYVGLTNPSHGPVPVFLILALTLTWTAQRPRFRLFAIVVLNFLSVFTGFGVLFGPIVCLLLGLDLWGCIRAKEPFLMSGLALLSAGGTLLFFLGWHYTLSPSVDCFVFPDPHPLRYLPFVDSMYLRALELHNLAASTFIAGIVVGSLQLTVLLWSAVGTFRSHARSVKHVTIFCLSGFCFLFCANTAVGRLCLGESAGQSSRYISYTMTGLLACYLALQLAPLKGSVKGVLLAAILVLFVRKELLPPEDVALVKLWSNGKRDWADCYLRVSSVDSCDKSTHFDIYPRGVNLDGRLEYMRARHLNLFKAP